jgi:ribulose-5-phosphate 4-epimerase/fuculose-1-phosphate aldolase
VHVARPEINCVAHAHSTYGKAFSTLGYNIDILTQDHCVFWNDVALYSTFRGAVLGAEEGHAIAASLGNKKAAILQNHGLLTCAQNIEACVWWFMSLENCCQVQLLADAAAAGKATSTVKIDEDEAEYTWRVAGADHLGYMSALPMFELVEDASRGYCF